MSTKRCWAAFVASYMFALVVFTANTASALDGAATSRMPISECREKAASGEAEAMWQLAKRYEDGDGVKKDVVKAVSLYRKAAEKRHPKACARMAELYRRGIVVKKDPALAAKYEAMANGESGEAAAAIAKSEKEVAKVDEIEVALDHILGRNGKFKDPKEGIRILYEAAKDKPAAQRVFVRRWAKGDLDEALLEFDDLDLERVAPWFANEFANGLKAAGQILGIDCYKKAKRGCGVEDVGYLPDVGRNAWENNIRGNGRGNADEVYYYSRAVHFWFESQRPKCLLWVAQFYDSTENNETLQYGGPESMKDDRKAILAYERCLSVDSKSEDARVGCALLYLLAKDEKVRNLNRAMEHFKKLLQMDPTSARYNYYYGYAGYNVSMEKFERDVKRYGYKDATGRITTPRGYNTLAEKTNRDLLQYLKYIQIAAEKGYEDAVKFIKSGNTINYRNHAMKKY